MSCLYITCFQNPTDVDPRLIVPVFDVAFPLYYLPESTREYLRFGLNHENKFRKKQRKKQPDVISMSTLGSSVDEKVNVENKM
ncbi:sodium-coupled monocarboxylate transporter 2 [Elysia marginata]|uniref:Sodium-coupled monocarboxylate transporter 2 n=1 Tax=Elysia marginata TaxID=1093978 RepID=A0AAV4IQ36_9GAST|nr:sodium-coupled monocarboxylate transporter 2 [Elysia marginata]